MQGSEVINTKTHVVPAVPAAYSATSVINHKVNALHQTRNNVLNIYLRIKYKTNYLLTNRIQ